LFSFLWIIGNFLQFFRGSFSECFFCFLVLNRMCNRANKYYGNYSFLPNEHLNYY
jgi:hypothetical protein